MNKLLSRALQLREYAKRVFVTRCNGCRISFDYVLLDRKDRRFKPFFAKIDSVVELYAGTEAIECRLAYYRPGDFIDSHVDELNARCAVSIRLDEGNQSYLEVDGVLLNEGGGAINVIGDGHVHRVRVVGPEGRIVLLFWIKDIDKVNI